MDIPLINTVTGQITPDQLGPTLMHEHLVVGFPGWESDTIRSGLGRPEMLAVCMDKIQQLKARGINSVVDASPNDLGRDVEFMGEVAQKADFQIICATGLYHEEEGGAPYWRFRATLGGGVEDIAELFIKELQAFRVKISISGHDSYEAHREGDHDDLVLAVAIGAWVAERERGPAMVMI